MLDRIRAVTLDDLELLLAWRNHPNIRHFMYSKHEISPKEHREWFALASKDKSRHLCIFEQQGKPCGFVSFKETGAGGIAEWGFYTAPTALRGTGRALGHTALLHAFSNLKLHKICGQALRANRRSIEMHKRLGFEEEGVLREQHFDGSSYHDVVCFGLLSEDWRIASKESTNVE